MGLFSKFFNNNLKTASDYSFDRMRGLSALGLSHEGQRDLYQIYGYPLNPQFADYWNIYKRNGIARRAVNAYPDACWAKMPDITDDDDTDEVTEFEQAVIDMFKRISALQYLNKFDKLQRIGRFGVLVIGGSTDLSQQAKKIQKVAYVMPYSEGSLNIVNHISDIMNFNYGKPEKYTVTLGNELTGTVSKTIHHSHIIHASENALDNDIVGHSCLEPILNYLYDMDKIVGGSAESFFLNSRGGLHVNSTAAVHGDDKTTLASKFNEYINKFSRILATVNMTVTPIDYAVHEPDKHFDITLSAIAGATGIPKAILTGNEVGVRASSQDVGNFFLQVENRQINFCEPFILRPFIDKCIELGALPEPKGGVYNIKWKPLISANETEKADVALKKMQAMNAYTSGLARDIMTPEQACEIIGIEYRVDDLEGIDTESDLIDAELEGSKDA